MANVHELIDTVLGGLRALTVDERDPVLKGIDRALDAIRRHFGMEAGLIMEFVGDDLMLQHFSSSYRIPFRQGQRLPVDGDFRKMAFGQVPQLIPDTGTVLNATSETPLLTIGSYLSVPLSLADGSLYGSFCCFSSQPTPSLTARDLNMLAVVADLCSVQIEADVADRRGKNAILDLIRSSIAACEPEMVYQPIFELAGGQIVCAEALSRFSQTPYRTPDRWFKDAALVGLRADLEIIAIKNAIKGYARIWSRNPSVGLAVNASATTLMDYDILAALRCAPLDRTIIEITEHDEVEDYDLLETSLARLRASGVRIAVDDAGSGYASLRHVLRLRPDIIKLDISLTRDIDKDPMRRALASAIVEFSGQTDCKILAEGIETAPQLELISELGVHLGQGFLLGRPGTVDVMLERMGA